MVTGKGSGLFLARSSPAFMRQTFLVFYANGRLDQPFAVFQEVSMIVRQFSRGRTLMGQA
jgi:hypothetical protein